MKKQLKPTDIESLGSTIKMVVFVEVEPLTDVFEQLMLTPKLAGKVRQAIRKHSIRCRGCGAFCLWVNEKSRYNFEDIKDEYDPKDVKNSGLHCPIDIHR